MRHKMELYRLHQEAGYEWWKCPKCGREIIFKHDPFEKKVLVEGDKHIPHYGQEGGLVIGPPKINKEASVPKVFEDYIDTLR